MNVSGLLSQARCSLALSRLRLSAVAGGLVRRIPVQDLQLLTVMGLRFSSPVGIAAGLDRYGEFAHRAHLLGLGFVETGTVTLKPERGHNRGIGVLIDNLQRHGWARHDDRVPQRCQLGISITGNSYTAPLHVAEDYLACMSQGWRFADYFTINLGSVLSWVRGDLRALSTLLEQVKCQQLCLARRSGRYVPVVLKLPFENGSFEESMGIVNHVTAAGLDGILAVFPYSDGKQNASDHFVGMQHLRQLVRIAGKRLAVISVGGICGEWDARERFAAGAKLLQIHRGLISPGPRLVQAINAASNRSGRIPRANDPR